MIEGIRSQTTINGNSKFLIYDGQTEEDKYKLKNITWTLQNNHVSMETYILSSWR